MNILRDPNQQFKLTPEERGSTIGNRKIAVWKAAQNYLGAFAAAGYTLEDEVSTTVSTQGYVQSDMPHQWRHQPQHAPAREQSRVAQMPDNVVPLHPEHNPLFQDPAGLDLVKIHEEIDNAYDETA